MSSSNEPTNKPTNQIRSFQFMCRQQTSITVAKIVDTHLLLFAV